MNAERLGEMGIRAVLGAESNTFLDSVDHATINQDWMNDPSDLLVFSNENFLLADKPERLDLVREMREVANRGHAQVTTIIYVRPATGWIPSMWAQYVKIAYPQFGTMPLEDFIASFDYESILDAVAMLRSEGDTIIRPYVRSMMRNHDVLDDFYHEAGVDTERLQRRTGSSTVNQSPSRRQTELARAYNEHRPPGGPARRHHLRLLNSFLRSRHYQDRSPTIAQTVTKGQLQQISDRYAALESELTAGEVDSRHRLPEQIAAAPEEYVPVVAEDAIDLYLQNMTVLAAIDEAAAPST